MASAAEDVEKGNLIGCCWVCKFVRPPCQTGWRVKKTTLKLAQIRDSTSGYLSKGNQNSDLETYMLFIVHCNHLQEPKHGNNLYVHQQMNG